MDDKEKKFQGIQPKKPSEWPVKFKLYKLVWSSKFQYSLGQFLWKNLEQLQLLSVVLSTTFFDCKLAGSWCKQISAENFSVVIFGIS